MHAKSKMRRREELRSFNFFFSLLSIHVNFHSRAKNTDAKWTSTILVEVGGRCSSIWPNDHIFGKAIKSLCLRYIIIYESECIEHLKNRAIQFYWANCENRTRLRNHTPHFSKCSTIYVWSHITMYNTEKSNTTTYVEALLLAFLQPFSFLFIDSRAS